MIKFYNLGDDDKDKELVDFLAYDDETEQLLMSCKYAQSLFGRSSIYWLTVMEVYIDSNPYVLVETLIDDFPTKNKEITKLMSKEQFIEKTKRFKSQILTE